MMTDEARKRLVLMFAKLEKRARDDDEKARYTEARLFHQAKLIEERAERARGEE